jgi:hypothetical protein
VAIEPVELERAAPTGWTLAGPGRGTVHGQQFGRPLFGWPGRRPSSLRLSVAGGAGTPLRSQAKVQALLCRPPSRSQFLPSVSKHRTFSGVAAIRGRTRSASAWRAFLPGSCDADASWLHEYSLQGPCKDELLAIAFGHSYGCQRLVAGFVGNTRRPYRTR